MTYQSLYRRFRPKTFNDVLGQEHITTTLKNQILSNNVAHAYLFSGTRGTGKTSTAKIFARAVNCIDSIDGNPCNECELCKGIIDDSIMDVVEMDAASNNSVDDVRELREKAKYPPSRGKYKVYIIDEVHMLSKGAFNALLKTLEEPPKHLLFILATTEPQKLPATIQSRCQRFDFKRIGANDIVKNMGQICAEINIPVEDKALHLIARNSDGAMRDALSILDQCVSFVEGEISYDFVLSLLGAVNTDLFFEISKSIIDKDLDRLLSLIDDIIQKGKDVNQFIKDLILHFRNLMIVKTSNNVDNIVDGTEEFIEALKEQAKLIELTNIIRCLNILSDAESQSKWSSQPRIILEIAIVKLVNPDGDLSIEGLSNKINELEKMLSQGKFSVPTREDSKVKDIKPIEKAKEQDNKKQKDNHIESEATIESSPDISVSGPVNLDMIESKWNDILKKIKKDKIGTHALIMEGKVLDFKNNVVTIAFGEGFGFHKDAVEKKENKEYIEKVISSFFSSNITIKFTMGSEDSSEPKAEDGLSKEFVDDIINVFGKDKVEIEK